MCFQPNPNWKNSWITRGSCIDLGVIDTDVCLSVRGNKMKTITKQYIGNDIVSYCNYISCPCFVNLTDERSPVPLGLSIHRSSLVS